MKNIINKTRMPIRVPLGSGKVLHLGPGKSGNVSAQAAERPAFLKLVERGDIELVAEGETATSGTGSTGHLRESTQGKTQRRIQRKGDR